jgi:hypothetical protein
MPSTDHRPAITPAEKKRIEATVLAEVHERGGYDRLSLKEAEAVVHAALAGLQRPNRESVMQALRWASDVRARAQDLDAIVRGEAIIRERRYDMEAVPCQRVRSRTDREAIEAA